MAAPRLVMHSSMPIAAVLKLCWIWSTRQSAPTTARSSEYGTAIMPLCVTCPSGPEVPSAPLRRNVAGIPHCSTNTRNLPDTSARRITRAFRKPYEPAEITTSGRDRGRRQDSPSSRTVLISVSPLIPELQCPTTSNNVGRGTVQLRETIYKLSRPVDSFCLRLAFNYWTGISFWVTGGLTK